MLLDGPKVIKNYAVDRSAERVRARAGRRRVRVGQGQRLELIGTATGGTPLAVDWLRNDVVIVNSSRVTQWNGRLTVSNVGKTDGGAYVFRASNSAGSDEETIEVTVVGKPGIRRPDAAFVERPLADTDKTYFAGQMAEVVAGRSVTLTTELDGDNRENLRIVWELPSGETIRSGQMRGRYRVGNNGGLTISRTTTSDSGTYSVRVNGMGGSDSLSTPLSVVGESVPIASVTRWLYCILSEPAEVTSATYSLDGTDVFPSSDGRLTASVGSSLVVEVSMSGLRGNGIAVTFDGASVDSALVERSVTNGVDTATLRLSNLAMQNSGRYTFRGNNAAGSSGLSFDFTVSGTNDFLTFWL